MGTLVIRLDDRLKADLRRLAAEQRKTESEVAGELLRRATTVEFFRLARKRLMPYAEKVGYPTDEDIFRDIS